MNMNHASALNYSKYRNPSECFSSFRKTESGTSVFWVDFKLDATDLMEEDSQEQPQGPLHIHRGWSRFTLILSQSGSQVIANISSNEVAGIVQKARAVPIYEEAPAVDPREQGPSNPEFDRFHQVIPVNGKTVAEIVKNQEEEYIIGILVSNLSSYPRNQASIDLIQSLADIKRNNPTLFEQIISSSAGQTKAKKRELIVHEEKFKSLKRKNKTLVYNLKISFIPGNNFPFRIQIENTEVRLKDPSKGIGFRMDNAEFVENTRVARSMNFSIGEFYEFIDILDSLKKAFDTNLYLERMAIAQALSDQQRNAYLQRQSGQQANYAGNQGYQAPGNYQNQPGSYPGNHYQGRQAPYQNQQGNYQSQKNQGQNPAYNQGYGKSWK